MNVLRPLRQAIALATLLSAGALTAHAADIPLSKSLEADEVTTKVLEVDAANHQVVLEGAEGRKVHVQLSDQAKDLGNLKAGDQVKVLVTHSVAAVLDTDIDKSAPDATEKTGVLRATADNPNPGGAAFRQVQVQLKITHIDLAKNQVTLEKPGGPEQSTDRGETGNSRRPQRPQGRPKRVGDLHRYPGNQHRPRGLMNAAPHQLTADGISPDSLRCCSSDHPSLGSSSCRPSGGERPGSRQNLTPPRATRCLRRDPQG